MKRWLIKILLKLVVPEITKVDLDPTEREEAYYMIGASPKICKTLDKILIEDTKEMMTKVAMQGDFARGVKYGAFLRTKAILDKGRELYRKNEDTESTKNRRT